MTKIKAILFDMDGVLIDAREWHYEALNKALGLFGFNISRESHLATFDGLPTRKKLAMLSEVHGFPTSLHSLTNELKQKYTEQIAVQNCRPNFSHRVALSRFKEQGLEMAVCSNSIRKSIELMLSRAGINSFFEFYISNEDVRNGKPDPEIYLTAMEQLSVSPDACLILEDNEHGIAAARDSGGHVMIINDPSDVSYMRIKKRINEIEND